jgi:Kef-type K+ transport system membrane component KefB
MRWLAGLFALILVMALFHRLSAGGPLEARATLALGFLVLAAFLGGDLARRWRLPRITGFLLVGFCCGPAWLGLVRDDEVAALRLIGDSAVALIALAAGAELRLEQVRTDRVTLTRLAAGAIGFPFLIVALVVLSVYPWFPLTVHQSFGDGLVVALALGTFAAASSPTVTMALIGEWNARGRFARTVLGVTVIQDVAVVALFAIVLVLGKGLASAGALNLALAGSAAVHLLGSVAVGIAIGALLGEYLRVIRRDAGLFLIAVALGMAALARATGLATVLIALSAGFYLENVPRQVGERLRAELQRRSLPVYVVCFALIGAGLHLQVLAELWPWILLLVGLRLWGLWTGLRWAGRDPAVPADLARNGWMGLVSQGGLLLGLAGMARRAFPEWGVSLEALIVAMIGVQGIAGPVWFGRALRHAGEVTGGAHGEATPESGTAVAVARGGL